MLKESKKLLATHFGYNEFRTGQGEIIEKVLAGQDTLGIMPTGGGKSICYQIPALLLQGVTLVISPLISLMKDQVDGLSQVGIAATYLNSTLTSEEIYARLHKIKNGQVKLVYVAPERLHAPHFLQLLDQIDISLVAIDEAHCISQWGHDFRPSYLHIKDLLTNLHPQPTVLALTATATPQVTEDIQNLLEIKEADTIMTGFARESLTFHIVKGQDRDRYLAQYIAENKNQTGIIYAATRKEVERLQRFLTKQGFRAGMYHAGMSEVARAENQEQFLYDKLQVIVATSAFGMGIDKSNVRYVFHYNIPRNMESYYQEAGRAGRDGEKSACILLFAAQDVHIQTFLIEQSIMEEERKEQEYMKLRKMIGYAHTEACLQQYILDYFGEENTLACGQCGNCTDTREQVDVTIEAQKVFSCMRRMNERFGKTMITKVLTGSHDQKIKSFRLDQLSTHGIMNNRTQKEVTELIDFLTAEGYLRPTDGQYPVLMLTSKAADVLRGTAQIFRKEKAVARKVSVDSLLFERLRAVRSEIATAEKVPPYIIFNDQTLREMSDYYPRTEEQLLQIKGVGNQKLAKYGKQFLSEIQAYCEAHDIDDVPLQGVARKRLSEESQGEASETPRGQSDKQKSHHLTHEMFQAGQTIAEIANTRKMTERTIENHLVKCAEEGIEVNWEAFLPKEFAPLIAQAVAEAGNERLTPIKQLLPKEVSYFMIIAYLQLNK